MLDSENAGVYNVIHGHFDKQADEMKKYILSMPDRTFNNAYYVSPNGDDNADGRTPETAWRTLAPVNALEDADEFNQQAVLFERGGLWRGGIKARTGTTYSAYGEGEKPRFYGSIRDYADEALWTPAEGRENVWQLSLADWIGKEDGPFITLPALATLGNHAGNILFIDDQGEVKMCGRRKNEDVLEQEFDYYHNVETGMLYLYYAGGNPAAQYAEIEIVPKYALFRCLEHHHHITIENLCMRYANFGVSCSNTAHHIAVRGCEIGWIGGCFTSSPRERYGNGIEFFGSTNDDIVEDNWIYQCFDAGYSNQGATPRNCPFRFQERDIIVQNNLIEKCCYNIEIWVGPYDMMRDCYYRNNILRFAGYNFERYGRFGSSLICASHVCVYYSAKPMLNVVVTDNLMDYSYRHFVAAAYPNVNGKGALIYHNRYAQKDAEEATVAFCWDIKDKEFVPATNYYVHSQEEMEEKIKVIDTAPREVFFDGVADHE